MARYWFEAARLRLRRDAGDLAGLRRSTSVPTALVGLHDFRAGFLRTNDASVVIPYLAIVAVVLGAVWFAAKLKTDGDLEMAMGRQIV